MLPFLQFIFDCLFPTRCVVCKKNDRLVCSACRTTLAYAPFCCPFCGIPSALGATCERCRKKRVLDGVVSVFDYENPAMQKIIAALKFEDLFSVLEALETEYTERLLSIPTLDKRPEIFPIPQSKQSFIARGYNQSALFARQCAKNISAPYRNLLSVNGKKSQHFKTGVERWENVETRITMNLAIAPRHAIVVDDIITTGATLEASARALKSCGVKTVWGFTLARQSKLF